MLLLVALGGLVGDSCAPCDSPGLVFPGLRLLAERERGMGEQSMEDSSSSSSKPYSMSVSVRETALGVDPPKSGLGTLN